MEKLLVLAIAVIVVGSGLGIGLYVYTMNRQPNVPSHELNAIVKNKLQNEYISGYTIESYPYKTFTRPLDISEIMKGFYSLEKESVLKEYYSL